MKVMNANRNFETLKRKMLSKKARQIQLGVLTFEAK
jgi:hypothetical protein